MNTPESMEKFLELARNPEFERRVSEATEQAILEMDKLLANEVKLPYITHIFARTLDDIASWLTKPKWLN